VRVINTHDAHMLPYIACLVAEELNVLGDSQERTVAGAQQRVVPIHVSHVPWWPAAFGSKDQPTLIFDGNTLTEM
jgi:hypothetical protein